MWGTLIPWRGPLPVHLRPRQEEAAEEVREQAAEQLCEPHSDAGPAHVRDGRAGEHLFHALQARGQPDHYIRGRYLPALRHGLLHSGL